MLDRYLKLEKALATARSFLKHPVKDDNTYALNLNRALILFVAALLCTIGITFLTNFKHTSLENAHQDLQHLANVIEVATATESDPVEILIEAQAMANAYADAISVDAVAVRAPQRISYQASLRPDLTLSFSLAQNVVLNDYRVAKRTTLALGLVLITALIFLFVRSPNVYLLAKKFAQNDAYQHTHALINSLPDGVAIWNADKKLVASNHHFRQFYGLDLAKSAPGTPYADVHQAARKPVEIQTLTKDKIQRVTEARFENRQWARILDYKLVKGGFVTSVTDISEQKNREIQLVKAHNSKTLYMDEMNTLQTAHQQGLQRQRHLLSQLSHAVRTPLNHIVGFADMMRCKTHGSMKNKTYEGYVRDIHMSGTGLLTTVSRLLSLFEMDCGHTHLAKRCTSMPKLFNPMIEQLKRTAKEKECVFECAAIPKVDLYVDADAARHAINTLFGQILTHTESGGHVQTAIWCASDGVLFEVHSSAIHFSDEQIDLIVSPFEAATLPAQEDDDDTILELAIVHRLVEQLGGEFHIEPDAEKEKGSIMILSLPIAQAQDQQQKAIRAA